MLVAPGVSFNVPYRNHFRITNLPDAGTLREVLSRIEELLGSYAEGAQSAGGALPDNVVSAESRFK